jgi:hypothetical protein
MWAKPLCLLFLASKAVRLTGHNSIFHIFPRIITIVGNGPNVSCDILNNDMLSMLRST